MTTPGGCASVLPTCRTDQDSEVREVRASPACVPARIIWP